MINARRLFNISHFKEEYVPFINGIMEDLYAPTHWGQLIEKGGMTGIINTDYSLGIALTTDSIKGRYEVEIREFYDRVYKNTDPKWSLLNYVNTHYTSFELIVELINRSITGGKIKNEDIFTFEYDYMEELDRIKPIILRYKEYLFTDKGKLIFHKILGAIMFSTYLGDRNECISIKSLFRLGNITDVVQSMPGEKKDAFQGKDVIFKLNNVIKTLQVKTFTRMYIRDGKYVFLDISNAGYYNVDYFAFVGRNRLYFFETKKNNEVYVYNKATQAYSFDEKLFKYECEV